MLFVAYAACVLLLRQAEYALHCITLLVCTGDLAIRIRANQFMEKSGLVNGRGDPCGRPVVDLHLSFG